ncbi:7270_t:CDS:10 [Cetraspora pellucida]|uniref:7270_t:CDS:1 n=1 Tax=Cetraspora pellucida TaxID=1433469 RepID=A0ACA9MCX0_9GLOM|nr:7270_t:CDS:10 [Cetraspora pellucida]
MEEEKFNARESQPTLTPTAAAQPTAHDVVMEEATNEKDKVITDSAVAVNEVNDQRIVEEFQYLLEKSQQLFAGLRDLSPTGGRQWQPYFQRTFEVYTKVYDSIKYIFVLENKNNYGLKRWEVGEIASKIGQLYYHYYETNYLHESYIFYEAIRERSYFRDVLDVKKDIVQKLLDELSGLVDDYIRIFKPIDSAEWNQVLTEIDAFLEAEKKLTPLSPEGDFLPIARRLQIERSPRLEKDGTPRLKLQEAILVGNYQNQTKFSELTLDMYHILQSLEREPAPPKGAPPKTPGVENSVGNERILNKDDTSTDEQSNINTPADKSASRRINPHKYLLHRPTFSQLMVYISTAFKEINENSALLLYLSADGTKHANINSEHNLSNGYMGGVATNSRKPADKADGSDSGLINCLHPNDLVPFTRKPLCIIVDSNNSTAFANFPKVFNLPFLCLMSPVEYPSSIPDTPKIGSLFTLFLHAPLLGFSFISNIESIDSEKWERCVNLIAETEAIIVELLNLSNLEKSLKRFLQDDFLRQFMVRFVLCSALLKAHNSFQEEKHFPSSCPSLPYTLFDSPNLLTKLSQITKEAQVESLYSFPTLVVEVNEEDLSPDDNNI